MWLSIISFLGGPVVSGLISAYKLHLQATTADATIAADLAGKEIAAQTIETQAFVNLRIAEIGHPWEPEKLAFYVWLVYFAKCVVWDTVLMQGSTAPLYGAVSVWCNLIVSFYFAKRGFENVARILKR
jgi:hypothetical protein